MAGVKRCLGLDLGSHSVKLAEMAMDKDGIRVIRMLSAPVPVGPSAVEEERNAAIVSAVRGLIKENKISTKKTVFGMPGQTVFVRRIRLPKAPRPRLHQIVQFEARQLIPFPLEKTLLQYQVFDTDDDREVEVLIVAMKKDTNLEFMRLVRRTGLKPIGISVATLALYNGQELSRFRMQDWIEETGGSGGLLGKGGKKGEAEEEVSDDVDIISGGGFEEIRAYVNVGARSTDIAICKSGKYKDAVGFTRSIPLGGNHISSAIMKSLGCDTYTQAENIKHEETAAICGAFEIEEDSEKYNREASEAATKVCDRLVAEIRRSLDYFISQPDGVAVDLVMLSGGTSHLPYLPSFLEEKLGLPVELTKDLSNNNLKLPAQYQDFDFSNHKIAVGLATQGLGISPLDVDFIPGDMATMRDFSNQYVELGILCAMIVAMIFFSMQMGTSTRIQYEQEAQAAEQQAAPVRQKQSRIGNIEDERKVVREKLEIISPFLADRDYWLNTIGSIQESKPAGVLVTAMVCTPDYQLPKEGSVLIFGEAKSAAGATAFVRALQARKERFTKTVLESPVTVRSSFSNDDVQKFRIRSRVVAPEEDTLTRVKTTPIIATPTSRDQDGRRGRDVEMDMMFDMEGNPIGRGNRGRRNPRNAPRGFPQGAF
ncbi:MAG: type IV pilus assembly protein PilM [Candidatus Sumerlaeia bacterium]